MRNNSTKSLLSAAMILTVIITLSACGSSGPQSTPDTTPPTVSSTSPPNGAIGVAVNTSITAEFSEAMKATTINTATFFIESVNGGNITGIIGYVDKAAIFTPSANLLPNTKYTVTLTTDINDISGNKLSNSYTWFFTTSSTDDIIPPNFSGLKAITNDTATDGSITLSWDPATDNYTPQDQINYL